MMAVNVPRLLDDYLSESNPSGVPSITEDCSNCVITLLEKRSHIVRLILNARVVIGKFGRKQLIPNAPAVYSQFVKTERGGIDSRALQICRQLEGAPKHRSSDVLD